MLKFFRNIRRNLLTENRLSQYAFYALGEIILVVVGILIALQINNWNEAAKVRGIINASLESLKINLLEDSADLKRQIAYNEKIIEQIDFSFKIISLPAFDNKRLSDYRDSIRHIADERNFIPVRTTFESMEAGSAFQNIKDQSLTEAIYRYYTTVDQLSNLTIQNNAYVKKHIESLIYQEMEFGSFFPGVNPYSNQSRSVLNNTNLFRDNHVFENALIGRVFRSEGEIVRSKAALETAVDLIERIDLYLKE